MLAHSSSIMQPLLETIIASRYDLMLIGIGLLGYMILFSSRNARAAKEVHKKVYAASEELEVVDTKPGLGVASVELAQVLKSIQHGATWWYHDGGAAQCIITELYAFLEKYEEYSFALSEVQAILNFCKITLADKDLPDVIFERVQSTEEWDVLGAFIRFYMDTEQSEKACNVFELHYSTFFEVELDEKVEWHLLVAALKCGRQSLAEHLLQTSQSNAAENIVTIQKWWRRKSPDMCEARVAHMGSLLNRLSNVFNERYPFEEYGDEEHSDDESTCFLGDDSDRDNDSDADSYCDELGEQ